MASGDGRMKGKGMMHFSAQDISGKLITPMMLQVLVQEGRKNI